MNKRYLKFIFAVILIILAFKATSNQALAEMISTQKTVTPSSVYPGDTVTIKIPISGDALQGVGPADILLVMDRSGSMAWNWNGGTCLTGQTCKIDSAKLALNTFVDETNVAYNKLGLVTYASAATRDIQLTTDKNLMKDGDAGKDGINDRGINDMLPVGATSIGSGLCAALDSLAVAGQAGYTATAPGRRAGVGGYVVLATDGQQNTYPSVYDKCSATDTVTAWQKAVNMGIKVYTVGIGNDVSSDGDFDCNIWSTPFIPVPVWCSTLSDLNGNGIKDGEDYMKDLANKASGKYYFAPDEALLKTIYEDILKEITVPFSMSVYDVINPNLFNKLNLATDVKYTDCKDPPFTTYYPLSPNSLGIVAPYAGWSFWADLGVIPKGVIRCIVITATVQTVVLPSSVGYPVDSPPLGYPFSPIQDPGFWHFIVPTAPSVPADQLPRINIDNIFLKIKSPAASPWIRVNYGDVGSIGDVNPVKKGDSRADQLVISDSATLNSFLTTKNWLVKSYGSYGGLKPKPSVTDFATLYQSLYNQNKLPHNPLSSGSLPGLAGPGNFDVTGDFVLNGSAAYSKGPATVFITGNMTINKDLTVDRGTGLVFVVKGSVYIDPSVAHADGLYLVGGQFITNKSVACPPSAPNPAANDKNLTINGAIW